MGPSNSQIKKQKNNTAPDIKIKNNINIESDLNSDSKDMKDFTAPDIKIKNNINIIESDLNSDSKDMKDFVPELIWIDHNIDNDENNFYKKILKDIILFKSFKTIEDGIKEIKKIKFKQVMLILTNRMFLDFIPIFEKQKTEICCSLNIIIFTQQTKIAQIEKICDGNEKISSGYLFNKINIFDDFEKIKEFIKKTKNKEYKKHKKFNDNL